MEIGRGHAPASFCLRGTCAIACFLQPRLLKLAKMLDIKGNKVYNVIWYFMSFPKYDNRQETLR